MKLRDYTLVYRIMHWAIALCVLLLLLTIFLRLTWLNKNNVASIIQGFMNENQNSLTDDQAIKLAKLIRKPMWNWHIYFGYTLLVLYAIRLSLPFFGEMKLLNPLHKELSAKEKFAAWVYIVFYILLAVSLVTGVFIELGPVSMKKNMESVHVLSIYYLLTFIVIHLAGVFSAEFKEKKGIVSEIISGRKKY